MSFDINQLNNLDYEEAEIFLADYLEGVVEQFAQSPEGVAYAQDHPEFGSWISSFTENAYIYEGFTLTKMTKGDVQIVMENLLPRKITLMDPTDAEDTIPELVAFWTFLKREYNLRQAGAIVTYLSSIKDKFTDWMFDPTKGGMAKNFILSGMQAGFDMTTQEGLSAFQLSYNQQILSEKPQNSIFKEISNLFKGSNSAGQLPLSNRQPTQQKPKTIHQGFKTAAQAKKTKRKKK